MSKCIICGEYDFLGHHKCLPKWYGLHAEDYGNDVIPPADILFEEGLEVWAGDPERAAVCFAEKYQADSSWYPPDMWVLVMDDKGEKIYKFVVNQAAVPSYWVDALFEPEVFDAVHEPETEDD